jgi:aspartate-semialdehyde dehydrogenase
MPLSVAVVGATGAVGREILRILEARNFPAERVLALASPKSHGVRLPFRGTELVVEALTHKSFQNVQCALFSAGGETAREFAPSAAAAGAVVIDNSSAFRMDDHVPLVVPEVNAHAIAMRPKNIIANPNCSTIQMVVALKPLHDAATIRHIIVSTYQATSGKGQAAVTELLEQSRASLDGYTRAGTVFPGNIAFNLLSDWKAGEQDYSEEEWKMVHETRKIMGIPALGISPTTVRVPVVNGHAESIHVRFEKPLSVADARALLSKAEGVRLVDTGYVPGAAGQPILVSGSDDVHVSRIRQDLVDPCALNLWVVADNLRKGAALNAVQIAERIFA